MLCNSAVPLKMKEDCLKKSDEPCSKAFDKDAHHKVFEEILKLNSYLENITEKMTEVSMREDDAIKVKKDLCAVIQRM